MNELPGNAAGGMRGSFSERTMTVVTDSDCDKASQLAGTVGEAPAFVADRIISAV
jgi:hypothetical protein